jgi:hypothetical protein
MAAACCVLRYALCAMRYAKTRAPTRDCFALQPLLGLSYYTLKTKTFSFYNTHDPEWF